MKSKRDLFSLLPLASMVLLFLTVRLFSGSAYYELGGDQCKYLTLGRNFPWHTLYNDSLYMLHPPLFGLSIGFFSLFLPLFEAGLFATLFWSILTFFSIIYFGKLYGLNRSGTVVAALYVSLSSILVVFDTHVSRMPILLFFTAAALVTFERYLQQPSRQRLILCLLANSLCLWVSDQALAIIPAEALIFVFHKRELAWRKPILLWGGSLMAYGLWAATRLAVYLMHNHYPAGMDGIIDDLRHFPVIALVQPNYLPRTLAYHLAVGTNMDFAFDLASLWQKAMIPLSLVSPLPWAGAVMVAGLIIICGVRSVKARESDALLLAGLTVLFFSPAAIGMPNWYGLPFIVPFAVMLGKSLGFLNPARDKIVSVCLGAAALALTVGWLTAGATGPARWWEPTPGNKFLFTRQPVTRGQLALSTIRELPGDLGVMAPVGFVPEVAYLTEKRVVALPFDAALLDFFVDEYDIKIIVLTEQELSRRRGDLTDMALHKLTAAYIQNNPGRYRPAAFYEEDYPAYHQPQRFFFYEVIPVDQTDQSTP